MCLETDAANISNPRIRSLTVSLLQGQGLVNRRAGLAIDKLSLRAVRQHDARCGP